MKRQSTTNGGAKRGLSVKEEAERARLVQRLTANAELLESNRSAQGQLLTVHQQGTLQRVSAEQQAKLDQLLRRAG